MPRSPFESLSILGVGPTPLTGAPNGSGTDESSVCVIHDARTRSYTGVLAVRGHSFALLGREEKEKRASGWSSVLAVLAREGSIIRRLQWLAVALPDDGRAVRRHLEDHATAQGESAARLSYEELVAVAGANTCRHEVLLAVQVGESRRTPHGSAAQRSRSGQSAAACAALVREMQTLGRLLADADLIVDGLLGPRALGAIIRRSGETISPMVHARFIPGSLEPRQVVPNGRVDFNEATSALTHKGEVSGERRCPPCVVGWPWPMGIEADWSRVRTDQTWQATYWIAEWPRVDVGPDFLAPLVLGSVRRSVSVVMEPVSPSRATRQVEQARTADIADSELRRRGGFLATARRSREAELVARREGELADGHASFRFSGYVTVTASSVDALEEACETTEQAAGQARLELRRLFGDQERAFACTLPLCRGLS